MKQILSILIAPALMLAGCTNYAVIEQARIGMTVDELLMIDTPCYYSGESDDTVTYNCSFSVPVGPYSSDRAIKPYIMTFENGKLAKITLDQKELDRQTLRDNLYYDYGFYYPYGYYLHYRGYPYW
jgi:hypothetical protein